MFLAEGLLMADMLTRLAGRPMLLSERRTFSALRCAWLPATNW